MSDRQPAPCPSDDPPPRVSPAVRRWRLWIDRGGGFDIWQGPRLTIGGAAGSPLADFAIRCAWPSRVATLDRSASGDRLTPAEHWQLTPADVAAPYGLPKAASHAPSVRERPGTDRPLLADQRIRLQPVGGIGQPGSTPVIHYRRPSPLSRSAVLSVLPPYRTVSPVNGLIWLEQTVLIGPESFNHARTPGLSPQQWVLFRRHDAWWIRGESVEPQPIPAGRMWQVADWSLAIQPE